MNIKPSTIFTGDNLPIMRGFNSDSVDLIYLDPPFNSNANYAAPIGSEAAGAEFKDTWGLSDIDKAWHGELADTHQSMHDFLFSVKGLHGNSMFAYLIYMAIRLLEMHRILKPTGSIYLHCDPTASHYLKLLMDDIFGKGNFKNEIVWHYKKWTNSSKFFQKNHDIILMYSNTENYTFNKQYGEPTKRQLQLRKTGYNTGSNRGKQIVRIYDRQNPKVIKKLESGEWEGRNIYDVNSPEGNPIPDVWDISSINGQAKERTSYPTQKPLTLLERIIKTSTNKGDIVLDPFCGCATACVAAESFADTEESGRKWIGIDISPKAHQLVIERFEKELGIFNPTITHRTDIPQRTDIGKILKYNDVANKNFLYGEQHGKCNGCLLYFPYRNMTIDHKIPKANGGTDHSDNLQLLCGACNSSKSKGTQEELIAKLKLQGIR